MEMYFIMKLKIKNKFKFVMLAIILSAHLIAGAVTLAIWAHLGEINQVLVPSLIPTISATASVFSLFALDKSRKEEIERTNEKDE